MSVWVKYRNASVDTTTFAPYQSFGIGVEDFQYVGVGGLINF
jgi:hypothetical protein